MVSLEKNDHKKYGLIGTLLFHGALAALFFLMVFRGPDPPLDGGSGIELNYGLDAAGYGDVQTLAHANESPNTEDSNPTAESPETDVTPNLQPQEPTPEVQDEKIITDSEESPVSVKEIEKPEKKEEKKEVVKTPEKPRALYPGKSGSTSNGNGTNGSSSNPTGNNNGDKPGSVGDQGNPDGSLEAKALYGKQGKGGAGNGGSGGSLEMPGWSADIRKPRENTQEFGRIVFEIKVDSEGEVVNIRTLESTVSASVKKLYEDEVKKGTYMRTGSKPSDAPEFTTGKVTFILK